MRAALLIAMLFAISMAISASVRTIPNANASPISYNLWGKASDGWGFSAVTISSPGPPLTAGPGELVAMNLFGADNSPHDFLVDYDGDAAPDPGEPHSTIFTGSGGITHSFTITQDPGTYKYFCTIHPTTMFGDFTVAAPPVVGGASVPVWSDAAVYVYLALASAIAFATLAIVWLRRRSTD